MSFRTEHVVFQVHRSHKALAFKHVHPVVEEQALAAIAFDDELVLPEIGQAVLLRFPVLGVEVHFAQHDVLRQRSRDLIRIHRDLFMIEDAGLLDEAFLFLVFFQEFCDLRVLRFVEVELHFQRSVLFELLEEEHGVDAADDKEHRNEYEEQQPYFDLFAVLFFQLLYFRVSGDVYLLPAQVAEPGSKSQQVFRAYGKPVDAQAHRVGIAQRLNVFEVAVGKLQARACCGEAVVGSSDKREAIANGRADEHIHQLRFLPCKLLFELVQLLFAAKRDITGVASALVKLCVELRRLYGRQVLAHEVAKLRAFLAKQDLLHHDALAAEHEAYGCRGFCSHGQDLFQITCFFLRSTFLFRQLYLSLAALQQHIAETQARFFKQALDRTHRAFRQVRLRYPPFPPHDRLAVNDGWLDKNGELVLRFGPGTAAEDPFEDRHPRDERQAAARVAGRVFFQPAEHDHLAVLHAHQRLEIAVELARRRRFGDPLGEGGLGDADRHGDLLVARHLRVDGNGEVGVQRFVLLALRHGGVAYVIDQVVLYFQVIHGAAHFQLGLMPVERGDLRGGADLEGTLLFEGFEREVKIRSDVAEVDHPQPVDAVDQVIDGGGIEREVDLRHEGAGGRACGLGAQAGRDAGGNGIAFPHIGNDHLDVYEGHHEVDLADEGFELVDTRLGAAHDEAVQVGKGFDVDAFFQLCGNEVEHLIDGAVLERDELALPQAFEVAVAEEVDLPFFLKGKLGAVEEQAQEIVVAGIVDLEGGIAFELVEEEELLVQLFRHGIYEVDDGDVLRIYGNEAVLHAHAGAFSAGIGQGEIVVAVRVAFVTVAGIGHRCFLFEDVKIIGRYGYLHVVGKGQLFEGAVERGVLHEAAHHLAQELGRKDDVLAALAGDLLCCGGQRIVLEIEADEAGSCFVAHVELFGRYRFERRHRRHVFHERHDRPHEGDIEVVVLAEEQENLLRAHLRKIVHDPGFDRRVDVHIQVIAHAHGPDELLDAGPVDGEVYLFVKPRRRGPAQVDELLLQNGKAVLCSCHEAKDHQHQYQTSSLHGSNTDKFLRGWSGPAQTAPGRSKLKYLFYLTYNTHL